MRYFLFVSVVLFSHLACLQAQQVRTFRDTRDMKAYRYVRIGNQEWFAENIRFDIDGGYKFEETVENKILGYYYTCDAAQYICPKGWRLPNEKDWRILIDKVKNDAKMLKSEYLWLKGSAGNNRSGFNAVPAGYLLFDGSLFQGNGSFAKFWISNPKKSLSGKYVHIDQKVNQIQFFETSKDVALPCRCIHNKTKKKIDLKKWFLSLPNLFTKKSDKNKK